MEVGANHKTEGEMKSSLLIPYSLLRRRRSILCSKLGQKKINLNPAVVPPMLIVIAFRQVLVCLILVPYLFTDSSKGRTVSGAGLKSTYRRLPLGEQLTHLLKRWAAHIWCLAKITRSLVFLPNLHLSCECPDPWAWLYLYKQDDKFPSIFFL